MIGMSDETAARIIENLEPADRELVRALRRAATITSAAGLPAEHRPAGFRVVAELELERAGVRPVRSGTVQA